MLKVLLKPHSNKVFQNNGIFYIDNGDNIFFGLDKVLKKHGVTINTLDLDDGTPVDCLVYCDLPYFWEFAYWKKLLFHPAPKILFTFESPMVNPFSHMHFFHRLFAKVYTWNDDLVNGKNIKKFNLPILGTHLDRDAKPYSSKGLVSVINSNTSTPIPLKLINYFRKDLYPERIKVINFFEKMIPSQFGLFGRGWNAPKKFSLWERLFGYRFYHCFKEAIPRNLTAKTDTLSRYKFNLCFENCVARGYLSEKILDCFKARTVPIYYGDPKINEYIPENCYIDYRKFKDLDQLLIFLQNMDAGAYTAYLKSGHEYMNKSFKTVWSPQKFTKVFLESISFAPPSGR